MGMAEGTSRFKQVNDLFVSDSESDSAMDLESPTLEDEPAVKRAKTTDDEANTEGKPKWCNPDPYYLVPPLDESREKRKDVVQLLRKAKLDAEKAATTASNAVTRNADFIGFGDEEDEEIAFDKPLEEGEIGSDRQGSRDSDAYPSTSLNGASANSAPANSVPATNGLPAPTASFSHRRNLHQMTDPTTAPAQGLAATPPIPQSTTTAAPDDALSEARALLHDLVAEDGVLPQKQKIDAAQHGKKRKLGADGEIARSWMAKDRASATPWYIDHSTTPSTTVW
jgi:non-canonical poly(A) RNA polymerase PAPD5/7